MKKIISILILTLMLFSVSVCAATVSVDADYRYDSVTNSFEVYGTIDDTRYGDIITVKMFVNDNLFDVVTTRTTKGETTMAFNTSPIKINSYVPTGTIKFVVQSSYTGATTETTEFDYYGLDTLYPVLKQIYGKMQSGDFSGFLADVETNEAGLQVDIDSVKNLSEAAKTLMKGYIKTVTIEIPADVLTVENQEKAMEALSKFREEFEKMCMVGKFEDITTENDFLSWYETYGRFLNMESYSNSDYFLDNYEASGFANILTSKTNSLSDIDKIKDRLVEVGALTKVRNGNAKEVGKVFDDFDIKVSRSLSTVEKMSVYGDLASQEFEDFDELSDKFDDYAKSLSSSSSRPSGNSGGTIAIAPYKDSNVTVTPTPTPVPSYKNEFADMDVAPWAVDAVNYLFVKGVVNGKTSTIFDPMGKVTRAEFVKMIVSAYYPLEAATEQIFDDVPFGVWYTDYIYTAYKNGLITGDNGKFRPNDNITREDMAVIICRIKGIANPQNQTSFNDNANISSYAVASVAELSSIGVINGMGDNTFMPKNFATRAQSAQMVYNLIKN